MNSMEPMCIETSSVRNFKLTKVENYSCSAMIAPGTPRGRQATRCVIMPTSWCPLSAADTHSCRHQSHGAFASSGKQTRHAIFFAE